MIRSRVTLTLAVAALMTILSAYNFPTPLPITETSQPAITEEFIAQEVVNIQVAALPTATPILASQLALPSAPGLNVSNQTCNGNVYIVRLYWNDIADENGYKVYRDGALIATLRSGTTTYDDVSPNYQSHRYRVEAFNGDNSASSSTKNSEGCVY